MSPKAPPSSPTQKHVHPVRPRRLQVQKLSYVVLVRVLLPLFRALPRTLQVSSVRHGEELLLLPAPLLVAPLLVHHLPLVVPSQLLQVTRQLLQLDSRLPVTVLLPVLHPLAHGLLTVGDLLQELPLRVGELSSVSLPGLVSRLLLHLLL